MSILRHPLGYGFKPVDRRLRANPLPDDTNARIREQSKNTKNGKVAPFRPTVPEPLTPARSGDDQPSFGLRQADAAALAPEKEIAS